MGGAHRRRGGACQRTLDIIVISDDDASVRYPGGKGKCYQQLVNLMPPHQVYIESHLGGGACMRHKRQALINIGIDRDERLIQRWRLTQPIGCALVVDDAASFLGTYSFAGDELVYADPPYVPTTRRRASVYRFDYTLDDHIRLLEVLTTLPCMVMISGYESELYSQRLAAWRRVTFTAMSHRGPRLECVWMNFPEPLRLHDTRFLGETFRMRQNWRRKHQRLLRRFEGMKGPERQHLLSVLSDRFGRAEESQ
jgi:DNA adenine methylase